MNRSSLAAERRLDEELQSSFSAWLRLPRLLDGEASTGWLGRTTCFKFSCRDGLEEPSASGWGGRRETGGLVHECDHQRGLDNSTRCVCWPLPGRPGHTGEGRVSYIPAPSSPRGHRSAPGPHPLALSLPPSLAPAPGRPPTPLGSLPAWPTSPAAGSDSPACSVH